MMYMLYLLLLALTCAFGAKLPTVKIADGKIKGGFSTSYSGKSYIEFRGIPYAQPPIGKLRFEEPQVVEPWMGTIIANQSVLCLQVSHEPGYPILGTEDCLYLNVFVPGKEIDQTNNLDVIVHIHGGWLQFGCGHCYAGPKYLMDRNIIYVSLNYRLNIFGFLSTGDENLPGNNGMKDQVMALKWIKNNIKSFGGNPDSITITGLSAGGVSVHYHYLSPLSRGLFTRGISVSGCALNPWTIQEKPLEKAKSVGRFVGCTHENSKDLVSCLKSRNGAQITEAIQIFRPWLMNPFSPVSLVVEKGSKNPFLPEHPYKMIVDGNVNDVPWIASVTTSEGLYPAADFVLEDYYLDELNNRWEELFPALFDYKDTVAEADKKTVSTKIKELYLQDRPISRETYPEVIQMVGDRLFVVDLELAARLQSVVTKSPVYFYVYDYTGEERETFAVHFTHKNDKYGVCHGDDVMFIFSNSAKPAKMTIADEKMKETLLDMWTTYAKSGQISVQNWTPVSKAVTDELNYLLIRPDQTMEMKTTKELGHRIFWQSLNLNENAQLFINSAKTEL